MLNILMALLLLSFSWAGPIPVLAVNTRSQAVVAKVDSEHYARTILLIKEALDHQLPQSLKAMDSKASSWKLQKFSVGLGVNGEIGLGPYKFGQALKQRFVYSRKSL